GPALDGRQDQTEGLGSRAQRDEVGHPELENRRYRPNAFGNSSGPSVEQWRGFCAGAGKALAEKGTGGARRLCSRRGSLHNCRGRRKGHDEVQSSRPWLKQRGSMNRIYEELFIVKPDAAEEEVDQYVEQLRTQLTAAGATVDKVEKWGKRKLAYRIDKYREGSYVLFQFS